MENKMTKEYHYSEIFYSIQGEGHYTGVPTAWLRFFLCNLQCDGFGQKDPTDPSSYILPYKEIDVSSIKKIEDLPVWKYGCDSSYSWSKKFKHLQHKGSVESIGRSIIKYITNPHNPEGRFHHPRGSAIHMCFTGGEPLMKKAQECSLDLLDYFDSIDNAPDYVTYETNGTQPLMDSFSARVDRWRNREFSPREIFMSVSPKLFTTSGEANKDAICPDIVYQYCLASKHKGQLKFVVNGKKESWDELDEVVSKFRKAGVTYPVWIMPVSATLEGQTGELENYVSAGTIAEEAFKRGFNVSARVHVYLWGNVIGT